MINVLHLVGSPTSEFFAELSRLYAADCLDAVDDRDRWQPHIAYVSPGGRWRLPTSLAAADLAAAPSMTQHEAHQHLRDLRPDVALPQLFCLPGMTEYRAQLDVLGIPLIGNPAAVMTVGADKLRTKQLAAAAGVAVPSAVVVHREQRRVGDLDGVTLPVVVKPADADNSEGVTLVRTAGELAPAVDLALRHSRGVLLETYVEAGREVRCGILEREGELQILPLEEYAIDAATKPIRDGADKLTRRGDRLTLVAKTAAHAWIVPLDDPLTDIVGRPARLAHRALGCRQYSLFDFRIDPDGRPWLLEAGLYCSFARTSVIATMAAAAGIELRELFAWAVDDALVRSGRSPVPDRVS